MTAARQTGYRESSGEIIACLDADTILTPGWVRTVLREFTARRGLACLSGRYIYDDLSPATRIGVLGWYLVALVFFGLVNQYISRKGALVQGGNHAVRRSVLERIEGYNTTIDFHGDDTDTSCRLMKVGAVKFTFRLPVYTSRRRLRKEGVLRSAWTYAINGIFVIVYGRPFSRTHTDVRG